jgi:pimeloyl-ACP methyl ester carboxylesterase
MKESVCKLGERGQLIGITTEPDAHATRRAACVLVSAGLTRKHGPYRLYTELARTLARDGVTTLRFDLGDVGDSQPDSTSAPLRERTANDIHAAVDHVKTRYGADHLFLGGVCSGAEDSLRYAEHDARVTGLVLVDPFAYETPGWRWRHTRHRVARRTLRAMGLYEPIVYPTATALVQYAYLERAESTRILETLLARGVRMQFVYTGGREAFNHEGQLHEMFPEMDFRGLVTVRYLGAIEHTQMLGRDRAELVETIAAYVHGVAGRV